MLPLDATPLLPQQFPFKMVDTLLQADEHHIVTQFTVSAENVLLDGDIFTEGGLIENMAQSAAAGTGYFYQSRHMPVPLGYIGAIKQLAVQKRPVVGDSLTTTITTLNQIGQASIVSAVIFLGKEQIASGELTIFVQQS